MFWCRYICPLGALSNLFKFTLWFIALILIFAILRFAGINVPWEVLLGVECLAGYLLEILVRRPKLNPQLLTVVRDADKCTSCGKCVNRCPYHIDVKDTPKVTAPECMLCGECIKACPEEALTINKKKWGGYIAPILVIILFAIAIWLGKTTEIPTISVYWNNPEKVPTEKLQEIEVNGLKSVRCYSSSMSFKAKLEEIPGVYGVKTYVKHSNVKIYYNPDEVDENTVKENIFIPTKFKISVPGPEVKQVKMITIRTEGMSDRMDPNYLGLQLRLTGKKYYGLESIYDCPLRINIFMDIDEPVDKKFLKEIVNKKVLAWPLANGGFKETPLNFEFVRLEKEEEIIPIRPYLERMFQYYNKDFKTNSEICEGKKQQYLEYVNNNFEKPIVRRYLPYLSNYLYRQEGIIGLYLTLNDDNKAAIRIKYCPEIIDAATIDALIKSPTWTIEYTDKGIVEENAKIRFKEEGKIVEL